jgi:hypothetical protein
VHKPKQKLKEIYTSFFGEAIIGGALDVYEGKTKEHPISELDQFKSSRTGTIGSREGIGDAI